MYLTKSTEHFSLKIDENQLISELILIKQSSTGNHNLGKTKSVTIYMFKNEFMPYVSNRNIANGLNIKLILHFNN